MAENRGSRGLLDPRQLRDLRQRSSPHYQMIGAIGAVRVVP